VCVVLEIVFFVCVCVYVQVVFFVVRTPSSHVRTCAEEER
jgi:hypothetical protein